MKATHIQLTCEYLKSPIGIEQPPRISWRYEGSPQTAYRIQIAPKADFSTLVYDSGVIKSDENLLIECEFPLQSMTCYFYRVMLQTDEEEWAESAADYFETGLLNPEDFNAKWLTASGCEAPLFEKEFTLKQTGSARLYIFGLGFYEATLNGKRIGERLLDPVWSDYEKRDLSNLLYPIQDEFSHSCYYVIHDVTDLLQIGENTLSVLLGNGWYNQHERNIEGVLHYGPPKLFCKLCVEGRDVLLSDESWQWRPSAILFNNVYFGEQYDARLKNSGTWQRVSVLPNADTVMRAQLCPPDRIAAQITPKLLRKCKDVSLYDMGVNSTGRVVIKTSAPAGTEIVISHAEELNPDLTLDFESTGGEEQVQQDRYISNGKPNQHYTPYFCLHGFRYFEVQGDASVLHCDIIHTDVASIGSIETSDPTINRMIEAYRNSQTSNLHCGVPSDCPHRERLGYTGDGQITADTAMYLWDMPAFYTKWMRDIADCQCRISGHVQHTAPFNGGGGGPGGWGCAIILLPYKMYLHYGDKKILAQYYDNMCAWMDYIGAHSEDFILTREEPGGWCLGDWCVDGEMALTESYVNSCYAALCADLMVKISKALGKAEQAVSFSSRAQSIKDSILRHFYHAAEGYFDRGKQGANAFAAMLGLCSSQAMKNLTDYYESNPHFDTGIFGTPILLETLCEAGQSEMALSLLTAKGEPSFSYWQEKGATTLHECWNSAGSHNHPMFGGVVGVMMRQFAGIRPDENCPGYKHSFIKPAFVKGLSFLKAETLTPMGRIAVQWKRVDSDIELSVDIPSNASATLTLPDGNETLTAGCHHFTIHELPVYLDKPRAEC